MHTPVYTLTTLASTFSHCSRASSSSDRAVDVDVDVAVAAAAAERDDKDIAALRTSICRWSLHRLNSLSSLTPAVHLLVAVAYIHCLSAFDASSRDATLSASAPPRAADQHTCLAAAPAALEHRHHHHLLTTSCCPDMPPSPAPPPPLSAFTHSCLQYRVSLPPPLLLLLPLIFSYSSHIIIIIIYLLLHVCFVVIAISLSLAGF